MKCQVCARDNGADASFCSGCGASLAAACPGCGRPGSPGAAFCAGCGRRLAAPLAPRPRDAPPAPAHLAEKARAARAALQGERKQVTVLFADVKGSMDLQEGLDPEEWHGVMDRFMRILADGVHRFEGTVDKFTGDGIMALFGAPVAHEDHARRACYTALHLAETVGRYSQELRRTMGLSFHVRMGLNSGEVIVGAIGDDSDMEYTAVGHTVGLAQRMESLAEPGRAYLTGHTARLAEGYFKLRPLGDFQVKGAKQPVAVSVLEGVGAFKTAYEVSRSRGLTRMVGRAGEMAVLESAFTRASEGNGQVVGVVGEAGVGKSRLCEEFVQSVQARGLRVLRAHGVSHGSRLPLLPMVALLRQVFGINDTDSPQGARDKTVGRVVLLDALDPSSDDLPILFDFLEVPDPDRPPPQLAPDARLRRLFAVLRRIIHRRSARETLVILLEDLHWFDPASNDFLELLVESYSGTRTLVLTNYRPEYRAPWMRHSYCLQLPLAPLGPQAVRELLTEMLGADPSLAELPDHIVERTGGNAFFVEEVVRALFDDGALRGSRGAYRLTRRLEDVRVPVTVQSLLAARIDRLPGREKDALQTASVIGRTFAEPVLRLVSRLAEDDLGSSLRSLCSAEFLQEEALYPLAEYRFWHPLTQEVAYRSLLGERRARLHGAVAAALAEFEPERADERAGLLAQHWEAAGFALEAARWHARAAHRSLLRDPSEAQRRWGETIRLLATVAESEETYELGATARTTLARLAFRLGADPHVSEALAEEAATLAERAGDPAGVAMALYAKGFLLFGRGRLDPAAERLREAVALGEQLDDPEVKGDIFVLAWVLSIRGPLSAGLRINDEMVARLAADPNLGARRFGAPLVSYNLHCRAWLLARMGRLEDAARASEGAAVMGREQSLPDLVAFALPVQSLVAYLAGTGERAVGPALEAAAGAEELGSLAHSVLALEGVGATLVGAGRGADALDPLQDALALVRDRHVARFEEASLLAYLADAHLQAGDGAAAIEAADGGVAVARAQRARVHEAQALLAHARALRHSGLGARALIASDLAEAGAAIEETEALAWLPFLHEERARLALAEDDRAGGERELRAAQRLFRASGATGHATRLASELA